MEPPFPSLTAGFAAVIVAAGRGARAGLAVPKQFAPWRGKPLLRHSVQAFAAAGADPVLVAIAEDTRALALDALKGIERIRLVGGGATRQLSVRAALEALEAETPARVLIHDAARPGVSADIIRRLLAGLDEHAGVIPVLPVVDSLALEKDGLMAGGVARGNLRRVQTPQAFRFAAILAAHRAWPGDPDAGDDAQVALAAGLDVALIDGDERLGKLTFAEDFMDKRPFMRIGTGYDVHRLAEGRELWLCGIRIANDRGLAGHSDADVAIHALVDALLGAAGAGDIGQHFPPTDAQWQGAASHRFLTRAVSLVAQAGYRIGNADLTIVCESPKIGPHREAMRAMLAQLMGVDIDCVNVKATTSEGLGFAGRSEGIAAMAAATLLRDD